MKHVKKVAFGCLYALVAVLAVTTIIERYQGTVFVKKHIYASFPFIMLWAIPATAMLLYLFNRKVAKRPAVFLIHLSFIVILCGALLTKLTGQHGRISLTKLQTVSSFQVGGIEKKLPFKVTLVDFKIRYYPGTDSPMDFISNLRINDGDGEFFSKAAMNHVFKYRGYRFYQSGYNTNGSVILCVAHDPYGIGLTYSGYLLLLLSGILFLLDPQSRFRILLRHPLLKRSALTACILFIFGAPHTAAQTPEALPTTIAEQFGDLYVLYNGRISPLQSLAKDFTIKLYGNTSYKGYTAEQVLTGWIFYPDNWKQAPMIRVKKSAVRDVLGLTERYARYNDFIDRHNNYKLDSVMQLIRKGDDIRCKTAFVEADEKFNLIAMLHSGGILNIYPIRKADNEVEWYSQTDILPENTGEKEKLFIRKVQTYMCELVTGKDFEELSEVLSKLKQYQIKNAGDILPKPIVIKAEKTYNKLFFTRYVALIGISFGLMFFAYHCFCLSSKRSISKALQSAELVWIAAVFVYLSAIIGLRWIAGQHIPLSNGFETMQFSAWCIVPLTLFMRRRFDLALPSGILLCSLALTVSMMGASNPRITQLVPVLNSPWLSIHVTIMMLSYSLLAFIMLNGIAAIILNAISIRNKQQIERLKIISQILLYPAVFCLAIGIFSGAVWANQTWGSYWSWDPKEVWALITLIIYSLPLYDENLPVFKKNMSFHWFTALAFICVLFTYIGVNFLLGGMHAYV